MLVRLCSRWNAESISSLTLFSVAATCACKNMRAFPICTVSRSVGLGVLSVGDASCDGEGIDLEGGLGRLS